MTAARRLTDADVLHALTGDAWTVAHEDAARQTARLQSLYAAVIRAQRRAERYPHSRVDTTELMRALEAFSCAAAEVLNLEEP